MRHTVKRQSVLEAIGEIGLVSEHRPGVFGAATASERGCKFNFEMNEERARCGEQHVAGIGAFNGSAAQSQHQRIAGSQAGNGGVLAFAKCSFAMTGEKFGDCRPGFGFDHVIDIHKSPAKAFGHKRADGGFA